MNEQQQFKDLVFEADKVTYLEGVTVANVEAVQKVTVLDFEIVPRHINGHLVEQRKSDRYVNGTAMCKAHGKLIANWRQNSETKAVLSSLSASIGIPIDDLVVTKAAVSNDLRGTWVHPKVALYLATWCSPDCYAAVISWAYDEVVAPQLPAFPLPKTMAEALRLCADSLEANERLTVQNTALLTNNEELTAATEELRETIRFTQAERDDLSRAEQALVRKLSCPINGVTMTQFFRDTRDMLGYSNLDGIALLQDMGIILKAMVPGGGDEAYQPASQYADKGYFITTPWGRPSNKMAPNPITDKMETVKVNTLMLYLTPNEYNASGQLVREGGYSWLLRKLRSDDRTQLSRLMAASGGKDGKFFRLAKCTLSRSTSHLSGMDAENGMTAYSERSILFRADGVGAKRVWTVARRKDIHTYVTTGKSMAEALENLNDRIPCVIRDSGLFKNCGFSGFTLLHSSCIDQVRHWGKTLLCRVSLDADNSARVYTVRWQRDKSSVLVASAATVEGAVRELSSSMLP